MSNESLDDLIKAMLEASQKTKVEAEQKLQEEKAREEERLKLLQAIKYQKEHLVNLLNAVVEKFNQQSAPTDKITVTPQEITAGSTVYQTVLYTLPNNPQSIILVFFNLEPALNLSHDNHGFAPLGAYLKGGSSKFLWCRANNNDRLGTWIGCRVSTPRFNPTDVKTYDDEHSLNEHVLRSLEVPGSGTTIRYENDVRREFAQVLLQAMRG